MISASSIDQLKVVLIGLGGLGSPAAMALAESGVKNLLVCDGDLVEMSNLPRQILFSMEHVGFKKVDAARAKLSTLGVSNLKTFDARVNEKSAEELFENADVVIDAVDALETKHMLSRLALKTGTPLIFGSALAWSGMAMRIDRHSPCLECVFGTATQESLTCSQAGIVGPVAGVIAAIQVQLALGFETRHRNAMYIFDGLAQSGRWVRATRDLKCSVHANG